MLNEASGELTEPREEVVMQVSTENVSDYQMPLHGFV